MNQAVEKLYVMEKIGIAPDSELYGFVAFSECLKENFLKVWWVHRVLQKFNVERECPTTAHPALKNGDYSARRW